MEELSKKKVIAIVGPTACGKTSLGVELCKAINGEVISADSMQIYKNLSVGTAKVTAEETQGIVHHGVNIINPDEKFSVADFIKYATDAVADITARGKIPVLVGGTGQYVESFLKGMHLSENKTNDELRQSLSAQMEEKGSGYMYEQLLKIDDEAAKNIHPNNKVRVLRALEHYYATGNKISEQKEKSLPSSPPYDSLILGLQFCERQDLYDRINKRVDIMLEQGLLQEAKIVYENKDFYITAAQAIGYKEFFAFFEQKAALSECVEKLKQSSRRYAKRQLTWFAHMNDIKWVTADKNAHENSICIAKKFLGK